MSGDERTAAIGRMPKSDLHDLRTQYLGEKESYSEYCNEDTEETDDEPAEKVLKLIKKR